MGECDRFNVCLDGPSCQGDWIGDSYTGCLDGRQMCCPPGLLLGRRVVSEYDLKVMYGVIQVFWMGDKIRVRLDGR